jgi:hypothetical protein
LPKLTENIEVDQMTLKNIIDQSTHKAHAKELALKMNE